MDPLSVVASVTGISVVAAKIIKTLTAFARNIGSWPASAQCVLNEVADLSACMEQVQAILLGDHEGDRSRKQLLMVEQLVIALSHCVMTMSELDKFLDSIKITQRFPARARVRWMRHEQTVAAILTRLQASKSSLNLMLITMTW